MVSDDVEVSITVAGLSRANSRFLTGFTLSCIGALETEMGTTSFCMPCLVFFSGVIIVLGVHSDFD